MPSIKELMIAYNPGGQIKVGPWPDKTHWSDDYSFTTGACYSAVRKMNAEQLKTFCFIEAVHIIVRDRVNPMAVHWAFMDIDEYQDGCADDMPHLMRLK